MCGINGFNWNDIKLIEKMNDSIKHRGPDDRGIFIDSGVSLGHVRLSILDLSIKGRQPMCDQQKSIWITYNGEIYNFKEIRKDLENKGYKFNSNTDTEVILNSYKAKGIGCVKEFNGIFAFCIYDQDKQCLYLVRDRLGIKPLYYYSDGKFLFSSEVKAFKAYGGLKIATDELSISEYFHTCSISRESFLKGIEVLKPGHYLKLDLPDGAISIKEYADVYEGISKAKYTANKKTKEKDLVNELDELLNTVVKDQLVSDAPLGAICSGGLDSSLVTAIASKYKENVKILNIKVEGLGFDESEYAHRVARHLGLALIEERLDREKYLELYQRCINLEDLPLSHPNSVGIYLISKRAKEEGLSVLLSGEGADELFAGYHQHLSYYKRELLKNIPFIRYILNTINHKGKLPSIRAMVNNMNRIQDSLSYVSNKVERQTLSYILKDLQYYLVPILRRTDRMSMGAGIEMRVPYLDNRLIDFSLNLPLQHRLNYFQGKKLLKKVAERYLPKEIIYRKKMGFPLPVEEWLGKDEFKKLMYSSWVKI